MKVELIHDVVLPKKTQPHASWEPPENRPSPRPPKKGKDPHPNHHLFSDYAASFEECNKIFSRIASFCL